MKNIVLFCLLIGGPALVSAQKFKNITETQNGFIGIGTKLPDALLTVKGTIHTQEVLVDLEGAVAPDYVFEKYYTGNSSLKNEYQFLSLGQIEKFLIENHHLPNVPSAQEMDENGFSLKAMNLLLLEKVEELTLHLIEQQKRMDILSQKVEDLENE